MHTRKLIPLLILFAILFVPLLTVQARQAYPDVIPLPDGFRPEGIAVGKGHTFYTGSLGDGSIYRGDLRTGMGDLLVPAQAGRVSVGMSFDERSGYLFVSGGPTGQAYVYDTRSGAEVGFYQLTTSASFINDVIVTRTAAYFTNSFAGEFYRLPLGPRGALPEPSEVETIPLGGDWVQTSGFNANGIEATSDGSALIIVKSNPGDLYRVDPETGIADRIELSGGNVQAGDGLLLGGSTLYVVQNNLNRVAVVDMVPDLSEGEIVDLLTDSDFRVPTTAARFGDALYLVNARFDTPPAPDTEYPVVRLQLN